jgi:hypothetical protein
MGILADISQPVKRARTRARVALLELVAAIARSAQPARDSSSRKVPIRKRVPVLARRLLREQRRARLRRPACGLYELRQRAFS